MARMDALLPYIYFEAQETGSMLCAQHALNALVQAPHFTAPDLAVIARSLDELEEAHMAPRQQPSSASHSSANYDETGFFSVQVMEEACRSVHLQLARWRSEEMAPRHDHPEEQDAFILNHDLHWYTIRRFGSSPHHFFNLDSTISRPEWISPTLLGMTLYQAEREGYSIFVVIPDSKDGMFPCEADHMATQVGDGDYINGYGYASQTEKKRRSSERDDGVQYAIENHANEAVVVDVGKRQKRETSEDEELRRAIAASLLDDHPAAMSTTVNKTAKPEASSSTPSTFASASSVSGFATPHRARLCNEGDDGDNDDTGHHDTDPYQLASTDPSHGFSLPPMQHPSGSSSVMNDMDTTDLEADDHELAQAIAASLADHTGPQASTAQCEDDWDEPSVEEMRKRRLARFG